MNFLGLFDKLGRQPVKSTRTSEVVAVLNYEDLKELLREKNLNQKETEKVIELYSTVYDGHTKWGMANAITEFARDLKDINRREYIEKAAFKAV